MRLELEVHGVKYDIEDHKTKLSKEQALSMHSQADSGVSTHVD